LPTSWRPSCTTVSSPAHRWRAPSISNAVRWPRIAGINDGPGSSVPIAARPWRAIREWWKTAAASPYSVGRWCIASRVCGQSRGTNRSLGLDFGALELSRLLPRGVAVRPAWRRHYPAWIGRGSWPEPGFGSALLTLRRIPAAVSSPDGSCGYPLLRLGQSGRFEPARLVAGGTQIVN